jgi:hypothetical protein
MAHGRTLEIDDPRVMARVEFMLAEHRLGSPVSIAWHWRYEFAISAALTGGTLAVAIELGIAGLVIIAASAVAIMGAVLAWKTTRRWIVGRVWSIVTPHRVRVACSQAWVRSTRGQLPVVLYTKPTEFGEHVVLWCRAGITAGDLEAGRDILAAACWAADVRVTPSARYPHLVVLEVIRRYAGNQQDETGHDALVWRGRADVDGADPWRPDSLDRDSASGASAGKGEAQCENRGDHEGPAGGSTSEKCAGPGEPPERYLTGELPERAPAGRRISLLVRITIAKPDGLAAPLHRFSIPPEGCYLTITVSAPALIPMGDLEQELHVPAAADSEPIRFGFTTGRAGLHSVTVRAFSGGTFLGELALELSVEVGAALEEGPSRSAVLIGLAAEPGEVTLQVSRTAEDRYSFQLIGEALYPVELTKRLAGDPTEVVGALIDELRSMAARTSPFATAKLVRNRIKNLGAQLWADVVPETIRRQFWTQVDRIKLFTVASDMDNVPWELLYPVDGDNDNGFLVEQFPVVRRVYGQGRVRRMRLDSAAYVVPPGSPGNAMDEVQAVRERLGVRIRDHGIVGRLDSLISLLDNSPNVLHFACHNQFTDKSGSVITLEGGPLRPSDLAVAVQTHCLAASSPLVFFNACRTAGEIPGLMQMMGWAKQFMGAGAGAFVGSLWAVRSSSARAFTDAFYHALITDRAPLGVASLQARQTIADDDGDPSWLAYTVYGNPSATMGDMHSYDKPQE